MYKIKRAMPSQVWVKPTKRIWDGVLRHWKRLTRQQGQTQRRNVVLDLLSRGIKDADGEE